MTDWTGKLEAEGTSATLEECYDAAKEEIAHELAVKLGPEAPRLLDDIAGPLMGFVAVCYAQAKGEKLRRSDLHNIKFPTELPPGKTQEPYDECAGHLAYALYAVLEHFQGGEISDENIRKMSKAFVQVLESEIPEWAAGLVPPNSPRL